MNEFTDKKKSFNSVRFKPTLPNKKFDCYKFIKVENLIYIYENYQIYKKEIMSYTLFNICHNLTLIWSSQVQFTGDGYLQPSNYRFTLINIEYNTMTFSLALKYQIK